jgi:hypothetical protein
MSNRGKAQINILTSEETKNELMRIARIRSIEQDSTITYLDLIKEAIENLIEMSGSAGKK